MAGGAFIGYFRVVVFATTCCMATMQPPMSPRDPNPDFDAVVAEAQALQAQLPWLRLVCVGGTAAALHAGHRFSTDSDHVGEQVRDQFEAVRVALMDWEGWKTHRIRHPVAILGERHGIQVGVRQQRRRFPLDATLVQDVWVPTPEETLRSLFSVARRVFETDGHHDTIMFILQQSRPVRIIQLGPEDQAEKYLLMRRMADEVARTAADAVVLLSESWSAPFDPEYPYRRASEAPDRREYVTGTLVQKEGEPIQLMARIARADDRVTLEQTEEIRDPFLWAYAPIYAAWKKPLPDHWREPSVEQS